MKNICTLDSRLKAWCFQTETYW